MTLVDIVGGAGATLTTVSLFPQALHVLKTRDTRAISLAMYALFTMGVALWGAYGVMTMQWSIIVANGVTVVLASIILAMKIAAVVRR